MRSTRFVLGTSFVLGCSFGTTPTSANPEAGKYDDYYSENAGGASTGVASATPTDASGQSPHAAKDSTGVSGPARRKGVARKLVAKKAPRDPEGGGEKPEGPKPVVPKPFPVAPLAITGFSPTAATPGTAVEIVGTGFSTDPKKIKVSAGGVPWPVLDSRSNRVLANVPNNAKNGSIEVRIGGRKAKSAAAFQLLGEQSGFGKTATSMHGLVGEVYAIGKEITKLPDFASLGNPTATIAVANLDVPPRSFEQGFPGVDGKLVEWFAIRFLGSLNVEAAGEYKLCLNSDDGSQLHLDGALVVDNDGIHAPKDACELVYMEPGEYEVDLRYFLGPKFQIALQWRWSKDGSPMEPVPERALFRRSAAP